MIPKAGRGQCIKDYYTINTQWFKFQIYYEPLSAKICYYLYMYGISRNYFVMTLAWNKSNLIWLISMDCLKYSIGKFEWFFFLLQFSQNIDVFRHTKHTAFRIHKTVFEEENKRDFFFLHHLPKLYIGFKWWGTCKLSEISNDYNVWVPFEW